MYGQPRNVTMIEDLPELNTITEKGGRYMQQDIDLERENIPGDTHNKFIRPPRPLSADSGMAPYGPSGPSGSPYGPSGNYRQVVEGYGPPETGSNHATMGGGQPMPPQGYAPPPPEFHPSSGMNCVDVNSHIQSCPICSRLYNHDKTIYIIVIVMLAIICLLLLKKVLNV